MRDNAVMGLSHEELTSLMEKFDDLGLSELVLSVDGARVELTTSGKPPAIVTTEPHHRVLAPTVGIVRLAPERGERVRADDIVCVLEVWTSSVPVKAGLDGIVRTVHAAEGTMVEYGQPLVDIDHV